MSQGRTLWEMLLDAFSGPPENEVYNPLKAKVGSAATINLVEWKDDNFFLMEIHEYRRQMDRREYAFVDYALEARQIKGDPKKVRLRLLPVDDTTVVAGMTHHALLLQLYDEMEYNEGLHQVVNDDTKKFQVLQDGTVQEEYWRINDVTSSYKAAVTVLDDENHDKKITRDEIEHHRVEYWDYWRDTVDEVGVKVRQYLFVEMNAGNGWFQIWRGSEIDAAKVMMF